MFVSILKLGWLKAAQMLNENKRNLITNKQIKKTKQIELLKFQYRDVRSSCFLVNILAYFSEWLINILGV